MDVDILFGVSCVEHGRLIRDQLTHSWLCLDDDTRVTDEEVFELIRNVSAHNVSYFGVRELERE